MSAMSKIKQSFHIPARTGKGFMVSKSETLHASALREAINAVRELPHLVRWSPIIWLGGRAVWRLLHGIFNSFCVRIPSIS
jgi:hypothetical protein